MNSCTMLKVRKKRHAKSVVVNMLKRHQTGSENFTVYFTRLKRVATQTDAICLNFIYTNK